MNIAAVPSHALHDAANASQQPLANLGTGLFALRHRALEIADVVVCEQVRVEHAAPPVVGRGEDGAEGCQVGRGGWGGDGGMVGVRVLWLGTRGGVGEARDLCPSPQRRAGVVLCLGS